MTGTGAAEAESMRSSWLAALLATTTLAFSAAACTASPELEEDATNAGSAVSMTNRRLGAVLLLPFAYERGGRPLPDHWAFQDAARDLASFYRAKRARVVVPDSRTELTGDPESLYRYLDALAAQGATFDRVIILSHGGADGPIWGSGGQIGLSWPEGDDALKRAKLVELGAKLKAVTSTNALLYLGQCRPGQPTTWDSGGLTFIEVLACITDRTTAGRILQTSGEDAEAIVKNLEEGTVPSRANFAWANDEADRDRPRCTELPSPSRSQQ